MRTSDTLRGSDSDAQLMMPGEICDTRPTLDLSIAVPCLLPKPQRTVQKCWAKPTCFDFSSSNFNVQCHILSASGVTLRACIPTGAQYVILQIKIGSHT